MEATVKATAEAKLMFKIWQITGVYAMNSTIYWYNILSFNITYMYAMFDHMYTFLLSLLFITGIYEFSKNFKFFVMFFDDLQ